MAGQYFEAQPTVRSRPATVTLDVPGARAELRVDRGVFSAGRVDPGTVALLRALPPAVPGPVLDLGCGYGAIACAVALRDPTVTVWAVDVNERAVGLTRANASELALGGVRACTPDEVPAGVRFATIVSNPPIRVGKDALHALLDRWLPRLDSGAGAWLVVQRHLGADSLAAWMADRGWVVQRRASKAGYRVLQVSGAAG